MRFYSLLLQKTTKLPKTNVLNTFLLSQYTCFMDHTTTLCSQIETFTFMSIVPARNTRTDFEKKNEEGEVQTHGPGSEIKCSANGNPSPDLKWDCEGGEYIRYGK